MTEENKAGLLSVLKDIENFLWEYDVMMSNCIFPVQPEYPNEMIRPIMKILMHWLADKIMQLKKDEGINIEDAGNMAYEAGEKLRDLIKIYTGIDTRELYEHN